MRKQKTIKFTDRLESFERVLDFLVLSVLNLIGKILFG